MNIRYANNPNDSKYYDTEMLRKNYLVDQLFSNNKAILTYSHNDRIIFGGVMPVDIPVAIEAGKELGSEYFLERREMGVINIGGKGSVSLDGEIVTLSKNDGLYIGMGTKEIIFLSDNPDIPAKFYINSSPAHMSYENRVITHEMAKKVEMGDSVNLNQRTINQYIHPAICKSCQLVMGLTVLIKGSVWNTMPCHTHDRRMEVYFYFGIPENDRIFHLMGEPSETRHIIVSNEQAVISPSWSIHSGVGTTNYSFIWGMCGENQTFTDMDHISMDNLK